MLPFVGEQKATPFPAAHCACATVENPAKINTDKTWRILFKPRELLVVGKERGYGCIYSGEIGLTAHTCVRNTLVIFAMNALHGIKISVTLWSELVVS